MHQVSAIRLSPSELVMLTAWTKAKSLLLEVVQRAHIVTRADDGVTSPEIAKQLEILRPTLHVQLWRERFIALRVAGLEKDAPGLGRLPSITATKICTIIAATLHTTSPAATLWGTWMMAQAKGGSEATVRRIWKHHNFKPHLVKTFKLSRDKQLLE